MKKILIRLNVVYAKQLSPVKNKSGNEKQTSNEKHFDK